MLFEEFERTKLVALRLTGQTKLFEKNPVLPVRSDPLTFQKRKSVRYPAELGAGVSA